MFYQNLSMSCLTCFTGHRTAKCQHTDKPLWARRNKGRGGLNGAGLKEQEPDFPLGLRDPAVQVFVQRMANDSAFRREYYHESPPSTTNSRTQRAKPYAPNTKETRPRGEDMYGGVLTPEQVTLWKQLCGLANPLPSEPVYFGGQVELDEIPPASDAADTPMDEVHATSGSEFGNGFMNLQFPAVGYIPSLEGLCVSPLDLQMDFTTPAEEQPIQEAPLISSNTLGPVDVLENQRRHSNNPFFVEGELHFEPAELPIENTPQEALDFNLKENLDDIWEEFFSEGQFFSLD